MDIEKFDKYEAAAIREIGDITRRVEIGELTMAEAEAKIVPIFQGMERAKDLLAVAVGKRAHARSMGHHKAGLFGGLFFIFVATFAFCDSLFYGEARIGLKSLTITGPWAVMLIVGYAVGGFFLARTSLKRLQSMSDAPPNYSLKRTDQSLRD